MKTDSLGIFRFVRGPRSDDEFIEKIRSSRRVVKVLRGVAFALAILLIAAFGGLLWTLLDLAESGISNPAVPGWATAAGFLMGALFGILIGIVIHQAFAAFIRLLDLGATRRTEDLLLKYYDLSHEYREDG